MSENEEGEWEEFVFFKDDESVIVTLLNGRVYIGDFVAPTDSGLCIKVTSKNVVSTQVKVESLGPKTEMEELKVPIKMLIPWARIDLVESAIDFYANLSLIELSNGIDKFTWEGKVEE